MENNIYYKRMKKNTRPIGVHLSIAGGISRSIARAEELGCTAFQVFVGNPRGWKQTEVPEQEVAAFKKARTESSVAFVAAHATYLINLASSEKNLFKKSMDRCLEEIILADRLAIECYIIHPGHKKEQTVEQATDRIAEALNTLIGNTAPNTVILMETTASGEKEPGGTFEGLASILNKIKKKERVGICLDTAHVLAAGYEIRKKKEAEAVLSSFDRLLGLDLLRCLHVNDSKGDLGTNLDRHENIGQGLIGINGFKCFLNLASLKSLPLILETPVKEAGDDARNIAAIRKLLR